MAFDGLTIHKPKYGIVVHGVPTSEIAVLDNEETKSTTVQEWEEANVGAEFRTVNTLRPKPRANTIRRPLRGRQMHQTRIFH